MKQTQHTFASDTLGISRARRARGGAKKIRGQSPSLSIAMWFALMCALGRTVLQRTTTEAVSRHIVVCGSWCRQGATHGSDQSLFDGPPQRWTETRHEHYCVHE